MPDNEVSPVITPAALRAKLAELGAAPEVLLAVGLWRWWRARSGNDGGEIGRVDLEGAAR